MPPNMNEKQPIIVELDSYVSVVGDIVSSPPPDEWWKSMLFFFPPSKVSKLGLPFSNETEKGLWQKFRESHTALSRLMLSDLIDPISELPVIPIIPETHSQLAILECYKDYHKALSAWLKPGNWGGERRKDAGGNWQPLENALELQDSLLAEQRLKDFILAEFSSKPRITDLDFGDLLERGKLAAKLFGSSLCLLTYRTWVKSDVLILLFPNPWVLWACVICSASKFSLRTSGIIGSPIIRLKRPFNNYVVDSK